MNSRGQGPRAGSHLSAVAIWIHTDIAVRCASVVMDWDSLLDCSLKFIGNPHNPVDQAFIVNDVAFERILGHANRMLIMMAGGDFLK